MIASSAFSDLGSEDVRKVRPLQPPIPVEPERVGLIGDLAASDCVDRRHHAAVAAEHAVGERHQADIGRRRRRGAAKLVRDRPFVATRVERAGRDIGARGRAADAGIAMQHQRLDAVPAAHECDQGGDVLVAGNDVAIHGHGDVIHAQNEVVGRRDAPGPLDPVGVLEQRDDVARAGCFDRVMKSRK